MNEPKPDQKKTILVVDDHQEILDFISDDLAESYRVETARDGRIAWEILARSPIDLVVSDLMMPDVDGIELCHWVKGNPIYKHIPFIMLTAKTSLQAKIEVLEYGADAYLEKPFSPSFLQAQIGSLLKNRQYLEEHYVSSSVDVPRDNELMVRLQQYICNHLENPNLSVEMLAEELHLSRATLYRRIKHESDLSPHELINRIRLNRAAELLNSGTFRVYEVSAMVGFNSCSHFIRNFQKYFGLSPKEWEVNAKGQKKEPSLWKRSMLFLKHPISAGSH